jgi:hypothetical protein
MATHIRMDGHPYQVSFSSEATRPVSSGFFEEIGAMSPPQPQDIPRGMEIAKKFGLEFLPPPDA